MCPKASLKKQFVSFDTVSGSFFLIPSARLASSLKKLWWWHCFRCAIREPILFEWKSWSLTIIIQWLRYKRNFCATANPFSKNYDLCWWKKLQLPQISLKKNPAENFGFSDPANNLHQPASSLRKNLKFFFGFSDPTNFLHQPLAPSKKILKKILGFQIPPTICISQLAPSKRILIFFLGFQIPPIFCISQPCSPPSLKKNLNFFLVFRSRQFSASAS